MKKEKYMCNVASSIFWHVGVQGKYRVKDSLVPRRHVAWERS